MVKLDPLSPHSSKEQPLLFRWDTEYRRNYSKYQAEIDKVTYQLQRSQRGFAFLGQWFYPIFHQREFLQLELLKKKQQLGSIFAEEVSTYSKENPKIQESLDNTFALRTYIPSMGLSIGTGLVLCAHAFNLPYSFRLGIFCVPVALDYIRSVNYYNRIQSLEFVDWALANRQARASVEYHQSKINPQLKNAYFKFVGSEYGVQDVHQKYIELLSGEGVEPLQVEIDSRKVSALPDRKMKGDVVVTPNY